MRSSSQQARNTFCSPLVFLNDSACNYQNEQSEKWIGEWMAARGVRDEMVIATKFSTRTWAASAGMETFPEQRDGHTTVVLGGKVLVVDIDFRVDRTQPKRVVQVRKHTHFE